MEARENNFLMQQKKKKCFHVYVKVTGIQAQAKGQKNMFGKHEGWESKIWKQCVCVCKSSVV